MLWELVVAATMRFVAYQFFMVGAYATTKVLRVVNLFHSVDVLWSESECFSVGSYGRCPVVAIAELRNERQLPIMQSARPAGEQARRAAWSERCGS